MELVTVEATKGLRALMLLRVSTTEAVHLHGGLF